jgi:hypothetical protein
MVEKSDCVFVLKDNPGGQVAVSNLAEQAI